MQFYYGEKNILRALDEAEFWKLQETEHAGLIPQVTPNLEPEYAKALEQYGTELAIMHSEVVKDIASFTRSEGKITPEMKMQMLDLVKQCIDQSSSFVGLMVEMLRSSRAVQASQTSQTVINHMIRESQYFIGIDQLILS
jgi:hypothetical protein